MCAGGDDPGGVPGAAHSAGAAATRPAAVGQIVRGRCAHKPQPSSRCASLTSPSARRLARGLGAPQDLPASYTWFAIAAAQGDTDASARQEELAQRLDEPARLVAQSAADAWRPETPDARANEVALPAHGWNDRSAGLPVRHFAA